MDEFDIHLKSYATKSMEFLKKKTAEIPTFFKLISQKLSQKFPIAS